MRVCVCVAYLVQHSWTVDIECLADSSDYLNKYHDEFVNKTGDEYILPVVDLDRLRNTTIHKEKTKLFFNNIASTIQWSEWLKFCIAHLNAKLKFTNLTIIFGYMLEERFVWIDPILFVEKRGQKLEIDKTCDSHRNRRLTTDLTYNKLSIMMIR